MAKEGEIRYGNKFGYGDVWPIGGSRLSKMTPIGRAYTEGWFHACPNVTGIIKQFGAEWTFKRYVECDWIHQTQILTRAKELNPKLYKLLNKPVKRVHGELPDSSIDRWLVPPSFEEEMSPLSTPYGYATSRIILVWAEVNAGKKYENGRNSVERVNKIKGRLDVIVKEVRDPIGLMLAVAREAMEMDADPVGILEHMMSAGILKEQGCKTMYREILKRMQNEAPKLRLVYDKMSGDREKMKANDIILSEQLK